MDVEIINRMPQLIDSIEAIDADGHKHEVALTIANIASPEMLRLLVQHAPDGTRWTEPYHGRPSIRLGLGKLEDAWDNPVSNPAREGDDVGAEVTFTNRAPQMEWVLEGVPPHPEPLNPPDPMIFFWFREGKTVRMEFVNHPGQDPNPFPREALASGGNEAFKTALLQNGREIFAPIRGFFSGND